MTIEYPKIETLFNRRVENPRLVDTGLIRKPEFTIPHTWFLTEKLDGMNLRIYTGPAGPPRYDGRTFRAEIPAPVKEMLENRFPHDVLRGAFDDDTAAIIYGEGIGPKIQKNGDRYSMYPDFVVFDVLVLPGEAGGQSLWLEWEDVKDIANKIGARTVPEIGDVDRGPPMVSPMGEVYYPWLIKGDFPLVQVLNKGMRSGFTRGFGPRYAEGVVARTRPMLRDRQGRRLMWKLKATDVGGPTGAIPYSTPGA